MESKCSRRGKTTTQKYGHVATIQKAATTTAMITTTKKKRQPNNGCTSLTMKMSHDVSHHVKYNLFILCRCCCFFSVQMLALCTTSIATVCCHLRCYFLNIRSPSLDFPVSCGWLQKSPSQRFMFGAHCEEDTFVFGFALLLLPPFVPSKTHNPSSILTLCLW